MVLLNNLSLIGMFEDDLMCGSIHRLTVGISTGTPDGETLLPMLMRTRYIIIGQEI